MYKQLPKSQKVLLITSIVGVVLTITTIVFAFVLFPFIIDKTIEKNIVLEEGTEPWDRFIELPLPLDFKVYFFHVENSDAVINGAKPILIEKGPYVYKEYRNKYDTKIDGDYVSYYQKQKYIFDEEASNGSQEDEIVTINALFLGLHQLIEQVGSKFPFNPKSIIPYVFDDHKMFFKTKIRALTFEGISFCDPKRANTPSRIICLFVMFLNMKLVTYNEDLSMSYSIFGFKNNTHDGLYKVNRGNKEIRKVGYITEWNNLTYTDFWMGTNSECDKIGGFDSTVYPPYIEKGDTFDIYSPDICRGARLLYDSESSYRDIDTYKFTMDKTMFIVDDPNDSCYCDPDGTSKGYDGIHTCYLDGTFDVQPCLGMPAILSLPHFLYADEKYKNLLNGIEPVVELHDSDMDIHPLTGVPVRGSKRVQFNFVIRPITIHTGDVEGTMNVSRSLMPMLWISEGTELNDKFYDELKSKLSLLDGIEIGKWVLVGVAAAIFIIPGAAFLFRKKTITKVIALETAPHVATNAKKLSVAENFSKDINDIENAYLQKKLDKPSAPVDDFSKDINEIEDACIQNENDKPSAPIQDFQAPSTSQKF